MNLERFLQLLTADALSQWLLIGFVVVLLFAALFKMGRVRRALSRVRQEKAALDRFQAYLLDGPRSEEEIGGEIRRRKENTQEAGLWKRLAKYIRHLEVTRRPYDPEIFIRQEFYQDEHDRLVSGDAIFVRIGLLGTFAGLIVGLMGIDTASEKALAESIMRTLGAMSLAFISSFVGLVLSAGYALLAKGYAYAYEEWEDALSQVLGQGIGPLFIPPPNEVAEQLKTSADAIARAATELNAKLSGLDRALTSMAAVSSHLDQAAAGMQAGVDSTTKESLGKIGELASALQRLLEEQRKQTKLVGRETHLALHRLAEVTESVNATSQHLPHIAKDLAEINNSRLEEMISRLVSARESSKS